MSAVSNPKEPKTSTNFCILCAVREELTYICRVCLTKVYPLFSDREEFILCSCRQGRLSSVFRQGRLALRANFWFILCSFRQGRLALRANFWFILCSFRQGRLALRANFWFILCSFRQGRLALRANFWFILCSFRQGRFLALRVKKQVYPLLIREVFVLFVWYRRNLQNGQKEC